MKTTLQQAVQALKRHRDIYFTDALELGQPRSSSPRSPRTRTAAAVTSTRSSTTSPTGCRDFVERDGHRYFVANPVEPGENFADRWHGKPERAEAFFRWIEQAKADFDGLARVGTAPTRSLEDGVPARGPGRPGSRPGLSQGIVGGRRRGQLSYGVGTGALAATSVARTGELRGITISMATTAHGRSLSMAQQALGLRSVFPDATLVLKPHSLRWTGQLQPCDLSRIYTIRIDLPHEDATQPSESSPPSSRPPGPDSCPTHTTTGVCACTRSGSGTRAY